MRTIKIIFLGILAAALVLVGVSNMTPVDIYLLPPALTGDAYGVKGVPLALVIIVAGFAGVVFGLVAEWVRERKQRVLADDKRRELAELRQELAQLRARSAEVADILPRRPAA